MDEDVIEFVNADSGFYLESLLRCKLVLKKKSAISEKLDEVILAELELALMAAEKAKSEILKANKDTVRPIK
jgi:hypothetical protein